MENGARKRGTIEKHHHIALGEDQASPGTCQTELTLRSRDLETDTGLARESHRGRKIVLLVVPQDDEQSEHGGQRR